MLVFKQLSTFFKGAVKYLRYSCEASDFGHKWDDTVRNFVKLKVLDQEKLRGIPWTFVKYRERVFQTFIYFHESWRNSDNIEWFEMTFDSFSKWFEQYLPQIFWHFTEFNEKLWDFTKVYKSLWKFTKVYESYYIARYFFGQIPCFCSVLFACNVLFAFRNFVRWRTKFSCLLSFRIASRQYRQIFRHCQMIGDISNIADT